jgi:hypothetical protein
MGSSKVSIRITAPGYDTPTECPACKANTVIFTGETETPGVFAFSCGTCKAKFITIPEGVEVKGAVAPGLVKKLKDLIGGVVGGTVGGVAGKLPTWKDVSIPKLLLLLATFAVGLFGEKLGIVIPGVNDTPVQTAPAPTPPATNPPVIVNPPAPAPTTPPVADVPAPPAPPAGEDFPIPGVQELLGSQKRKTLYYKGETYVEVNFVDLAGAPAKSLADPGSDEFNPSYEKALQDGRMITTVTTGSTPKSEMYLKKSIWDTHKATMAQHYP